MDRRSLINPDAASEHLQKHTTGIKDNFEPIFRTALHCDGADQEAHDSVFKAMREGALIITIPGDEPRSTETHVYQRHD